MLTWSSSLTPTPAPQAEVTGATVKKKEGQFRISLRKLDEAPWYTLKKK